MNEHALQEGIEARTAAGVAVAPEAFAFVREGLKHTVRRLHGPEAAEAREDQSRHISGRQLCLGLREYALDQYGMLARTVLARWGVRSTEDFGRIVYAMIDAGVLRKSERDSPEDFRGVYDFAEAFSTAEP